METLKMKFNLPYAAACARLEREVLPLPDYPAARLFRWGNMMAMAVIEMLKSAERELGEAGQRAVSEALVRVGREVGRMALEGVEVPAGVEPIEFISAFCSWINREIYASPEDPRIDGPDRCSFDILWCPHQDSYRPFDCRVQRYLVQGMIEACRELFPGTDFQVRFTQTIPAGAPTCVFEVWRKKPGDADEWEKYSRMLSEKALEKARTGK